MATSISDLFVSVSADVSQAINGLKSVNTQLQSTSSSFKNAAPAALLMEGAAAGVGVALGAAVNVASDFEHQMSGVKAVLSPDEVNTFGTALTDLALQLGRDTVFSSRDAAAAIEELVKAGVPVESVLGGAAQGAIDLAAATGVTTADAAQIAAQALNTFNLNAADSTAIVDKLAGVANSSASDISFLRFGMASAAGVAAAVGLSFQDTADALGILSKSFASGSDAGTSLKTFLQRLQPTTKQAAAEFKKLGIITDDGSNAFFDEAGHVRKLADIAEVLRGSLSGMTDEQRQAALNTLFGSDAIRAALGLYSAGADGVRAFTEQTGQSGIASQSAKTRLDNLEGSLNNLGGSFEKVQVQIGTLFLPLLRDVVDRARSLIDNFGNLSPDTQRLAIVLAGGAAAALGLVGAFILLAPAILALPVAFGALGAVLAFVIGPVGLVALALGALVAAFAFAYVNSQDFRNAVNGLWDLLSNKLAPAIGEAAGALTDQLGPFFAKAGDLFSQFVAEVGPKVLQFFSTDLPAALSNMGTQLQQLGPLFNSLTNFFGAVFNVIGSLATVGGTALQGLFQNVLVPGFQSLGAVLAQVPLGDITNALGGMATNLGTLGEKVQPLVEFFTNAAKALNDFATAIQNAQLPDFLKPGTGVGPFAPGVGPQLTPATFTPGGAGGGTTGPLVQIGNITVTNEADEDRLVSKMATAIANSARRVTPPPDNSGIPQLDTGII